MSLWFIPQTIVLIRLYGGRNIYALANFGTDNKCAYCKTNWPVPELSRCGNIKENKPIMIESMLFKIVGS